MITAYQNNLFKYFSFLIGVIPALFVLAIVDR